MNHPTLHVVLVEPEIHTNTGNIGRLCVAAGAVLHLIAPLGFEISDSRLRRAGLDYWPLLEWQVYPDLAAFEERRVALQARPWYASGRGRKSYTEVEYQPGDALYFGKESVGLPPELLEAQAERTIHIPIRPEARSLNLAHAVGIVVFEALRQFDAAGLNPLGENPARNSAPSQEDSARARDMESSEAGRPTESSPNAGGR